MILNMFKSYLILILIVCHLFFTSCNDKKSFKFNEKLIDKISNENLELPSSSNSIILFCRCKENRIALTYVQELRGVYKYKYNKMKFSEFLSDALNQKIDISYKNKIECFEVNANVKNIYENNNFEEFINLYCDKSNKKEYRVKKNISDNELKTVLYYFFINNYLATFDDYAGYYFISSEY